MSKRKPSKKEQSIFLKKLSSLNDSKFFAGIVMLIMNIGS